VDEQSFANITLAPQIVQLSA